MLDLHLANGVRILSGTGAKTIDGNGRNATSVTVSKGDTEEVLPAQAVLVSTGARIQTEAVPANLKNPDGSVAVNSFLQTTDSDIYAAGDIASFPSLLTETNTRIEHWLVAQ
jgi:3-phenylpropionate/trans-cinnamate dioxygenase ferredoxin reductase subunit